jgi:hypothetical protein
MIITILLVVVLIIAFIALGLAINAGMPVDTDDDGYANDVDRFPFDPSEWNDTDMDGVGDNSDAFPTNSTSSTRLLLTQASWSQNPDTGGETQVYVPPDADYLTWSYTADQPIEFTVMNTYNEYVYAHYYTSSGSDTIYIGDPFGNPAKEGMKSGLWSITYVNDYDIAVRMNMEIYLVV